MSLHGGLSPLLIIRRNHLYFMSQRHTVSSINGKEMKFFRVYRPTRTRACILPHAATKGLESGGGGGVGGGSF